MLGHVPDAFRTIHLERTLPRERRVDKVRIPGGVILMQVGEENDVDVWRVEGLHPLFVRPLGATHHARAGVDQIRRAVDHNRGGGT